MINKKIHYIKFDCYETAKEYLDSLSYLYNKNSDYKIASKEPENINGDWCLAIKRVSNVSTPLIKKNQ